MSTAIDGDGPWLWSCVGAGGGASASCSATSQSQAKVDGSCGAASNALAVTTPSAQLCDSGVPSSVYGEGPWTWTCSGLNGGIASTCSSAKGMPKAPPPPGDVVNGICGASNGVAASRKPVENLCTSGTVTPISGSGPWNWSCLGGNGGMTVSCTAPLMPPDPIVGACGTANGVSTLTAPKGGLCSAGISSAVSGKGPWTWSCSGTNGGGAVSCVAPMTGKGGGPLPSMVTPSAQSSDEAPAPLAAPSGLVTPRLPTGPLKPLSKGEVPKITPSKPLEILSEASAAPPIPALQETDQIPVTSPELPQGTKSLTPPSMRRLSGASSETQPSLTDAAAIAGGKLALDPDISILNFSRGSEKIEKSAIQSLDKLASLMQTHGASRILLVAYADNSNITPREARRLSLARALAVRDYLVGKGITSDRVSVRALGANVPSGDMDRVDIKVN
ncbi:MAG: OmpA family protein [Alphaproteobacteria bacterium]|nr:OmpA family protein [Alphaproteobacteria bacterium]